jgi:pSer/pThr/pTyr-binding forkhead associated (FHA) protein
MVTARLNMMGESSMSEFQEACGTSGPLLLKVEGEGVETETFSLPQPFALIGRDARADILLNHTHVSKHHAYLQVIAGRVFCVDLGSRSGTRWDDRNRSSGWLVAGSSIGVGPYRISLGTDDPDAAGVSAADEGEPVNLPNPLNSPDPGTVQLPGVILEALNAKTRSSWRIDRMLALVGKAPDCLVELPNQGLSRFHCSLLRTPWGIWVIDLLGREGILVNGQSVRSARLDDGDALSVGRILFRVRYTSTSGPGNDLAIPSRTGAIAPRAPWMPAFPQVPPPPAVVAPGPTNWLSTVQEPGRTLAEGSSEPLVQLMAQQFDRMQLQMFQMQQQMSDQFHQMMMAMLQAFGAMHQDQMSRVQEELDQIRRVSDELKALQDRSARASSSEPDQGETDRLTPARSPEAPRASKKPAGVSASRRAANGSGHEHRKSAAARGSAGRERTGSEETADFPQAPGNPPSTARSPGLTDDHLHDVLSQRIAELQRERQTRWHRILSMVAGRS